MSISDGRREKKRIEEKKAIEELQENIDLPFGGTVTDEASKLAIRALEAQIKMKEWIEAYNEPEFNYITWNTEEVICLLNEFLA